MRCERETVGLSRCEKEAYLISIHPQGQKSDLLKVF
jgi:hypothetical protein